MNGWQIALTVWGGWWALAITCAYILGRAIHRREHAPRRPHLVRIPAQRKEHEQ